MLCEAEIGEFEARTERSATVKIGYVTERPYRWVPEDEVFKNNAFFAAPNQFFDREKAADGYNYSPLVSGRSRAGTARIRQRTRPT